MLPKLIVWAEWSDVKQLLSPQFFRVMTPRKIAALIREMYRNFRDDDLFALAKQEAAELSTQLKLGVVLTEEPGPDKAQKTGDLLLRLYFGQLFYGITTFVDLRAVHFTSFENQVLWKPNRLIVEWDQSFLDSIRALYRAFYSDDDPGFEEALAQLNLQGVSELFREHFGGDDQRAVLFSSEKFLATFREILSYCKEEGVELHRQFGVLGVYLGTLYEHLEATGQTYDVRSAFEDVVR